MFTARVSTFVICCLGISFAYGVEIPKSIEFNLDSLDLADRSNIDLSYFSSADYIMPGDYEMDIYINNKPLSSTSEKIRWIDDEKNKKSKPCITIEIFPLLGIKEEIQKKINTHINECIPLTDVDGIRVSGDLSLSRLNISIPQAYLDYEDANWVPPSKWNNGINGALFDYYVLLDAKSENKSPTDSTVSGYGITGFNINEWRFRGDWQAKYLRDGSFDLDWSRYYAWRAIPRLNAKLTIGENYTSSSIFNSILFSGFSLTTDEKMLPPHLRGYAPEVRGIAKTNAKVVIYQGTKIVKEVIVPPGPFVIQDLNSSLSGTLDVRIQEEDGSEQKFAINIDSIPYLTRPGTVRFNISTGRPVDYKHKTSGAPFASGEFSWGVSNNWSVYGGSELTNNYQSVAIGAGRDLMSLGALSFDVTTSRAVIIDNNNDRTAKGNSYKVSYAKNFDELKSKIRFAGYRFSDKEFMGLNDFISLKNDHTVTKKNKNMYTVSFTQTVEPIGTNIYMSYDHRSFWDKPSEERYTLTFDKTLDIGEFRGVNISSSLFRTISPLYNDKGFYISMSIPVGTGYYGYNSYVSHGTSSNQISYYDRNNDGDSFSLNAQIEKNGRLGGTYNHLGDFAQFNVNISSKNGNLSNASTSVQGGVTATMHGMAFHRNSSMGSTRMLVDSNGVKGIPIKGSGPDITTSRFGYAVISDLSDYRSNSVNINVNSLADDAEVKDSVVRSFLTEGAIGLGNFDVISGKKLMAEIYSTDGAPLPFGTIIKNQIGQEVGIVSDSGTVYLTGIKKSNKYTSMIHGIPCSFNVPDYIFDDDHFDFSEVKLVCK